MIILGSGSPRRRELLKQIGMEFYVDIPEVEEYTMEDISDPQGLVEANSLIKAKAIIPKTPEDIIVTADTVVALNGKIFGKPKSEEQAYEMLRALAGEIHEVYTGITLAKNGEYLTKTAVTKVEMQKLIDDEIWAYIRTQEPMDKAGAYGIQGYAAKFIKGIVGCYFNVVGLPLNLFYAMFKKVDEENGNS